MISPPGRPRSFLMTLDGDPEMASFQKPRHGWWSRLHLLARILGLAGLLAASVGLVLIIADCSSLTWENLWGAMSGPEVPVYLFLGGMAAVGLALLVEILTVLFLVAARRSAFGTNVFVQVVLAVVLIGLVNTYSYFHYLRCDWTSKQKFTLPEDIQAKLRGLTADTTIVVYQGHAAFGALSKDQDRFDTAAERKVVEKVKDLADLFREFGRQFKVIVLDKKQQDLKKQLQDFPPELQEAINQAPENSIFFAAEGRVQRLSFNDFYQLDKTASEEADNGNGNLVLRYQGVEPFARKVLNIDERRPRVAVGVVHEVLTTEGGSDTFGMPGVRKALLAHGFATRDIILKKWSESAPPEAATFTFEESKLDRLEAEVKDLEEEINLRKEEIKELEKLTEQWRTASLKDLSKSAVAKGLRLDEVTEPIRQAVLKKVLRANLEQDQVFNELDGKELDRLRKEREGVSQAEETLAEQRRLSDLRSKTARLLADCDMLILPRMTLFDVNRGPIIPNRVYRLDPAQVAAIHDFLRAGKPVLVCLGPVSDPPPEMGRPPEQDNRPDGLEQLLEEYGLRLSRQTVLFNVESKSFAQRRGGLVIQGANVEVPPLRWTGRRVPAS